MSKLRAERVTLDLNLAFARDGVPVTLSGIVVAEVKYEGKRHAAEFAGLMHLHHVRDTSFSKYRMGVSLLHPAVKHNRFKAKRRLVARLAGAASHESC